MPPPVHFLLLRLARATDALCLPDPAESIPTILDGFHSQEVWAGHTVELPCTASGYPIPAIRWLKDGRPLPADSRWTKRITGLTVSDLRTEDSGTYICEVINTFGSAEATGTLTVIGERGAPRPALASFESTCFWPARGWGREDSPLVGKGGQTSEEMLWV